MGKKGRIHKSDYSSYSLPAVLIFSAIVFSPSLGNGFVSAWDDQDYVMNNELIRQMNLKSFSTMFFSFFQGNYHPLTLVSYALECRFLGFGPAHFHFFNYAFHLFNVLLLYRIADRLTEKPLVAGITSLLFGIHPMHVESVAWISERKDVLFTCFLLGSIFIYIKKANSKNPAFSYLSLALFLCSLLSKAAAVVLPLLLLLVDYYRNNKITAKDCISKIPYFVLSMLFGIIAIVAQKSSGAVQTIEPLYSISDRFFMLCYASIYYLFEAILPLNLCAIHFYPVLKSGMLPIQYYLALPSIILLIWFISRMGKFRPLFIFGSLFYLASIFPVLQFIPVGRALVAERYSYLPYIGLFFIAASLISAVSEAELKLPSGFTNNLKWAVSAFILLLSFLSFQRNKIWENGIVLFSDVTEKYPEEGFAWAALAESKAQEKDSKGALEDFNKAISLSPLNPVFLFDRGIFLLKSSRLDESISDFTSAINLNPDYQQAWCNRGLARLSQKKPDLALSDFSKAIEIAPEFTDAWFNRGNAYYQNKNFEKAISDYSSALRLKPAYVKAVFNRGVCKLNLSDKYGACEDFHVALKAGHAQAAMAIQTYCQ